MNNRKSIVFLLLAIAALLAANFFLRPGARRSPVASMRSLLDGGIACSRLTVERKGAPTAVLERSDEWKFVRPYSGKVDERAVLKVLDALAFTPVADVLPDSELLKMGRTRADFALTEPVLRVTVSDGLRTTAIAFGGPTPSADGVYASVDESDAVMIVPSELFATVDQPADAFRQRALFPLALESVAAFDIKRGMDAAVAFSRDDVGWRVDDERAEEPKIRQFLTELLSAAAVDFVWPTGSTNETERASEALLSACGLEPESAVTVTLKGVDGETHPVSFGKNVDERFAYALVLGGSAVVTLPSALRDAVAQAPVHFADSRLFPVDAKSVVFFSVSQGETTCVLSRGGDGTWQLESPVVAPADSRTVASLLERLLTLSAADAADEGSGLSVSLSTNAVPVTVFRESLLGKGRLEDLRSRDMVSLDPLLAKRVVRTTGGPEAKPVSVVYARDRRAWNLESSDAAAKADETGIASVLSALNPLTAVRVEKLKVPAADLDDYGLDRPFLTIAVDQDRADVVRRNILVGGKTVDGRFATVGSSDAVFVISDETVRRLSAPIASAD